MAAATLQNLETDNAMTNSAGDKMSLQLLEATLETFGADRTRWPAQRRHELSGIVAQSSEAERLIAESQALDRLLDMAPVVAAARRTALGHRIVAAANGEARSIVVPMTPARRPIGSRWENATAGMALAASLMLGVLAGSNQAFTPAMQDIASAAGWDAGSVTGQVAVNDAAANDEDIGLANEDLL